MPRKEWCRRVHALALKYLELYSSEDTTEDDVSKTYSDECFSLGIRMDCGESFIEKYGVEATKSADAFQAIRDRICDVDILASEIFSYWRYITHWSESSDCLDAENRAWFIAAWSRLAEITEG